jgi:hypothetical protein
LNYQIPYKHNFTHQKIKEVRPTCELHSTDVSGR